MDKLVRQLCMYPDETPWLEFKHNNYDPDMIGQDISALANVAAYAEKSCAYMIWGINDKTHDIESTKNNQYTLKIGNQEIVDNIYQSGNGLLDVSEIAVAYNGGGHLMASGFSAEGDVEEILSDVLSLAKRMMKNNGVEF